MDHNFSHRGRRRWTRTVVATAASLLLPALAISQTITSIGSLSPTTGSEAFAINADGTAVTGYGSVSGILYAVRWTASGGLQNLGLFPGGIRSLGFAINGDGTVVTGMGVVSGGGHVFRWSATNGVLQDLGTLAGQNVSYGFAISAAGDVIAGGPSTGGQGHALRWTSATGLIDLGTLPGGATSAIYGLNADGTAAAGFSDSPDGPRAILWVDGEGMQSLGVLPGGAFSEGEAISAYDTVVAGVSDSAAGERAFRWTSTSGMEDLGTVTGRTTSSADAISADGSVIAGHDEIGAILWTKDLGMVDLRTYLASQGVNVSAWTLSNCYGISADATALTGTGRFNGAQRGWVVRGLPPLCAPRIAEQPVSTSACPDSGATFSLTATGGEPLTYQWQIEIGSGSWVTLGNDPLSLPCGGSAHAVSPFTSVTQISVHPCPGVTAYAVRAVVTNGCGSAMTQAAALTIRSSCRAGDVNCDSTIDFFDIDPFLLALFDPAGYGAAHPDCTLLNADMNGDVSVDFFDIDPFVACLFGGPCP